MQAKEGVIDLLNRILTADLTAVNQYFLHSKICEHLGYERLHHTVRQRSIDEMRDVEALIEHILYLEGVPNLQRLGTVSVGETVPEQFEADLAAEQEMLALLTEGVTHCVRVEDYTTRDMLEAMLQDVDEHIDWIETQQELIRQVGLERYLSEQIKREES
jgi:bacterioferritin